MTTFSTFLLIVMTWHPNVPAPDVGAYTLPSRVTCEQLRLSFLQSVDEANAANPPSLGVSYFSRCERVVVGPKERV